MNTAKMVELSDNGFCILKNQIEPLWLEKLRLAAEEAFVTHRKIQLENDSDVNCEGVALNVLGKDPVFLDFLSGLRSIKVLDDIEKYYFKCKFILNSFSALNNIPEKMNFSGEIHRDSRFFSGMANTMLNMLVLLDDFTEENGPTLLFPDSHIVEEKPSVEDFEKKSIKILGQAGDILLFNSNMWHSSSYNNTNSQRRALPLTFSIPALRQLFDYPKAIGDDIIDKLDTEMQQLLGYHSQPPSTLEEWYQPQHKRSVRIY